MFLARNISVRMTDINRQLTREKVEKLKGNGKF